jgi:hypothetical protein
MAMPSFARCIARLASVGVTLVAAGCYDDHTHYVYHCDGYSCDGSNGDYPDGGTTPGCISGVANETIDTGQFLELDPGFVGVSGEYFGNGAWRFAMACDTPTSGYPCAYDISVWPLDGDIQSFAPENLEQNDHLIASTGSGGKQGVNLTTVTDNDIDAFTLEATPGSTLEVNLTLDGLCASPYFFWSENGKIVSVSSTLVDLAPTTP